MAAEPRPCTRMLFALAELHHVPDDEEVAGQTQLFDHGQLALDLGLGTGGQRPEAAAGAVPGDVTQVGAGGLARGQRVVGEAIPQIGQGEIELLGQLESAAQGYGQIGEQAIHLGSHP